MKCSEVINCGKKIEEKEMGQDANMEEKAKNKLQNMREKRHW